MMFETSAYHEDCHAMRQIYRAGGFGKLIYSEGEYFHYMPQPLPSFHGWRVGLPPQWYPTHSNAYYVCVSGGSFTEVSCMGMPSADPPATAQQSLPERLGHGDRRLFRTNEGGMARMVVSWDTPGAGRRGRPRPRAAGSMWNTPYNGDAKDLPDLTRPATCRPSVAPGGHGGSHGHLMNEFVTAILQDRQPLVDIYMALNLTVPGIVAHHSAIKGGELMKIPQYQDWFLAPANHNNCRIVAFRSAKVATFAERKATLISWPAFSGLSPPAWPARRHRRSWRTCRVRDSRWPRSYTSRRPRSDT